MFGAATAVAFSLVVQIGEQVDYLRFLPEKTAVNRKRWYRAAVLVAGPGAGPCGRACSRWPAARSWPSWRCSTRSRWSAPPSRRRCTWPGMATKCSRHSMVARLDPGRHDAVRAGVADQDQPHQCLRGLAGLVQLLPQPASPTAHPGRVVWLVFNVLIAVLLMTLGRFPRRSSACWACTRTWPSPGSARWWPTWSSTSRWAGARSTSGIGKTLPICTTSTWRWAWARCLLAAPCATSAVVGAMLGAMGAMAKSCVSRPSSRCSPRWRCRPRWPGGRKGAST